MLDTIASICYTDVHHREDSMKKPILSLPIDRQLDQCLRRDMRDEHLSRADIVRRILRLHYGLIRRPLIDQRMVAP